MKMIFGYFSTLSASGNYLLGKIYNNVSSKWDIKGRRMALNFIRNFKDL
jgi:hypothetical protein